MLWHSERSAGLLTLGMIVRCSFFHFSSQVAVPLMAEKIFATSTAKRSGYLSISCGRGLPSTIEDVFFWFLRRQAALAAKACLIDIIERGGGRPVGPWLSPPTEGPPGLLEEAADQGKRPVPTRPSCFQARPVSLPQRSNSSRARGATCPQTLASSRPPQPLVSGPHASTPGNGPTPCRVSSFFSHVAGSLS